MKDDKKYVDEVSDAEKSAQATSRNFGNDHSYFLAWTKIKT
jgi:hypothetical protein